MSAVYFVQRPDGVGPIKIGCTAYLDRRLAALRSTLKIDLVLLATAPGGFRDEGRLHRQFAADRQEGEWFSASPEVLSAVDYAARHGKLPPPPEEDREIVMAARYLGGETLQSIGDDFGMTRERVRQLLRKSGVPSLGNRKSTMRQPSPVTDWEREVAELYASGTVRPKEIYALYGIDQGQLASVLRRTGTKRFGVSFFNTRPETDRITRECVELYEQGIKTAEIAERVAGVHHQAHVYRFLARAGVTPTRRQRVSNAEQAGEIVAAYKAGMTLPALAERFGIREHVIKYMVKRHGATRSKAESESIRIAAVRSAHSRRAHSNQQVAA